MAKEHYTLTVEPITCVHIGTGEQLSPLDYKISRSKQGNDLFVNFSSDSILKRIAADPKKSAEFERLSSGGDMKALAGFFHENAKNADINYICHCTREFLKIWEENKDKDPLQNGRFVEQMYRQGMRPVIPGSSLKGAVRTAVLNQFLSQVSDEKYDGLLDELNRYKNDNSKKKFEGKMQQELLNFNDAKNDPFRALQFGDCVFDGRGTQIVGALKNIKTDRDGEVVEHNTSQILAEAIKGYFLRNGTDANLAGEARFALDVDLAEEKAVSKKITIQDIVNACNYFYWREFKTEYEKFYKNACGSECDAITKLHKELKAVAEDAQKQNEFIIRVGRWSQVEFVTFDENFRSPKTRRGKDDKPLPYGKTRTVFNYDGLYLPLGWCKCSFVPL